MVILPLITDELSLDLKLSFKNVTTTKEVLRPGRPAEIAGSIQTGKNTLSLLGQDSYYNNDPRSLTSAIRKSILYCNESVSNIDIIGKNYQDTEFYDIYTIPAPPMKEHPVIDFIYGLLVNDLRLAKKDEKGRELSLVRAGMEVLQLSEKLDQMEKIRKESYSRESFLYNLRQQGFMNSLDMMQFFNTLEFSMIDGSIRSKNTLTELLATFSPSHGRMEKELSRYLKVGEDNFEQYLYLEALNRTLFNEPLQLLTLSEKQRTLIKKGHFNG